MSMLLFMPWCKIAEACPVGDITILPFEVEQPLANPSEQTWLKVREILSSYKDITGHPVDRAALIQHSGKALADDLTDEEIDQAHDLVSLACFSALSKRELFGHQLDYCNSDCFTTILQKFGGASSYTALTIRRRDGCTRSARDMREIAISVPVHCSVVKRVSFDNSLLRALLAHRQALKGDWGRWQNSVACFNHASTDDGAGRDHVDWVLLCSAAQHLLNANSNAKDVARLFHDTVVPASEIHAQDSIRKSVRFSTDEPTSIRYAWMREFYRVRGDFAHGKLNTQQPMAWEPHEHLLLATIAFPLVVKSLLNKAGAYKLSEDDEANVACFEKLAGTPNFFSEPPDLTGSEDSQWQRMLADYRSEQSSRRFMDACLTRIAEAKQSPADGHGDQS